MRKIILLLTVVAMGIFLNSCSKDSSSSSSTSAPANKVQCTVGGVSKSLSATAIKTNSEIAVTATLTTGKSSVLETIKFVAYENVNATNIYDFVYTKDGVDYAPEQEADLVNALSVHSGGKLVGTFSGTVKDLNTGNTITLSAGSFNVSY